MKRLYERIAQALTQEILAGEHAVGARLPSERDLAARFGVSRPTIREAMIALEVDGLVEVCIGSGVYVRSNVLKHGRPGPTAIGPFEFLEARALIEGEAAALAAAHVTDEAIAELEALVAEMEEENGRDVVMAEDADRRFHLAVAAATENSAILYAVETLWNVRHQSPQSVKLFEKVRAKGLTPRIDEHVAILEALRARDPKAARAAMRAHLQRVVDMVFEATEAEAVERARAEAAEKRKRYRLGSA